MLAFCVRKVLKKLIIICIIFYFYFFYTLHFLSSPKKGFDFVRWFIFVHVVKEISIQRRRRQKTTLKLPGEWLPKGLQKRWHSVIFVSDKKNVVAKFLQSLARQEVLS